MFRLSSYCLPACSAVHSLPTERPAAKTESDTPDRLTDQPCARSVSAPPDSAIPDTAPPLQPHCRFGRIRHRSRCLGRTAISAAHRRPASCRLSCAPPGSAAAPSIVGELDRIGKTVGPVIADVVFDGFVVYVEHEALAQDRAVSSLRERSETQPPPAKGVCG